MCDLGGSEQVNGCLVCVATEGCEHVHSCLFIGFQGALNMYRADCIEEIMSWKPPRENCDDSNKRMVLIFHCEFSSQRGPSM